MSLNQEDLPNAPEQFDIQGSSGFKVSNPNAFVLSPKGGGIRFDIEGSGAPKQLSIPIAQPGGVPFRNDAKMPAPSVTFQPVSAGASSQPSSFKQPENIVSGFSMNLKPPVLNTDTKSQGETPVFGAKSGSPPTYPFQQSAFSQQSDPQVQIYQAQKLSPYQPVSTSIQQANPLGKTDYSVNSDSKNPGGNQLASGYSAPEGSSLDDKVLCLKVRIWWFIMLACIALLLILIIGCTATPKWVYQGTGNLTLQGGLLVCTSCPGGTDNMSYASIISDNRYCNYELLDGFCDTIKNLQAAGGSFLAFTIFTVVVLLVWTAYFVLEIMKKKFPGPKWIPYLFPSLTLLFNFIAVACWGGASGAKFKSKDHFNVISTGSKEDICATDGPGLMLFIFLFIIFFCSMFVGIYFFKNRGKGKEEQGTADKPITQATKNEYRV